MNRARSLYRSFLSDETAQDLVEYVLLAVLLGGGVVFAWYYILSSSVATVYLTIVKTIAMVFGLS